MITSIDDPYARIILFRIAGQEWESVLNEEAVPILDRVAIAVCNLDDAEVRRQLPRTREKLISE